jgi:hypothetical protein
LFVTKDEALDLALEALESCGAGHITDGGNQWHDEKLVDKAITAIKQARLAPVQEPVAYWIPKAEQFCIADPSGRPFAKAWEPLYTTPPAAPVQPVAWVDLLKQAEEIVRSKSLWKKFIDGTPLSNDIAVWMATFAQEHATPPAAQRQWVGLTDDEINSVRYKRDWTAPWTDTTFARAIEAKLKEKNT